jgi:hypothetical protein
VIGIVTVEKNGRVARNQQQNDCANSKQQPAQPAFIFQKVGTLIP